jgi:hypothetical protein
LDKKQRELEQKLRDLEDLPDPLTAERPASLKRKYEKFDLLDKQVELEE